LRERIKEVEGQKCEIERRVREREQGWQVEIERIKIEVSVVEG